MNKIPPLPSGTILLVEVGSTAHGTGVDGGEDHDEAAIVIETADQVVGLTGHMRTKMHRTQPEGVRSGPGDVDRTLYSARTFLSLATSGNPSILMMLWAPVIDSTSVGMELRSLSNAFVGRHVIPRYRGYMQSQGMRILGLKGNGHGRRGGGGREELISEHGWDVKFAMHAARLGFQCIELLTTGKLELPIPGEPGDWLRDVRYGRVSFEEWFERCIELDEMMKSMLNSSDYREGPDTHTINNWSISAHLDYWNEGQL